MRVEYKTQGGSTIILEVVETRVFRRKPIFSARGNYMYTEHYYEFDCIFNQSSSIPNAPTATYAGTTDNTPGDEPLAAGIRSDNRGLFTPVRTDVALRHHLSQPRKELLIRDFNDDNTAAIDLRSPAADQTCDAKNGPIPNVMEVTQISEKTWFVRWSVKTWINETRITENEGSEKEQVVSPSLIEHEWRMSHSLDERYYTTRIIQGRCIFNTQELERNNFVPDDFRKWFFPPPPNGYKRESVDVHASEDGAEVRYVVVDKEQRLQLRERGIVKIECEHGADVEVVSGSDRDINATLANIGGFSQIVGGIAGAIRGRRRRSPGAGFSTLGSIVGGLGGAGQTFVNYLRSNLPTRTFTVTVRVFGSSTAGFGQLQAAAYRVLQYRFGLLSNGLFSFNVKVSEKHLVHEGVVVLTAVHTSGLGDQLISGFGAPPTPAGLVGAAVLGPLGFVRGVPRLTDLVPADNHLSDVGRFEFLGPIDGSSNAPSDSGSRGSDLAVVISQALKSASTRPQRPQQRIRDASNTDNPHSG